MEIVNVVFKEKLIIEVKNQKVIIVAKHCSHGDISFGVDAPKSVSVDREEVFIQKQSKEKRNKS